MRVANLCIRCILLTFSIETNSLESKYAPLDEPVKLEAAKYVISDHKAINEELYEMKCPYDPSGKCIGKFDGSEDFNSEATILMVSSYTYQSLLDLGLVSISYLKSYNITEDHFKEHLPFEAVHGLPSEKSIKSIQGIAIARVIFRMFFIQISFFLLFCHFLMMFSKIFITTRFFP